MAARTSSARASAVRPDFPSTMGAVRSRRDCKNDSSSSRKGSPGATASFFIESSGVGCDGSAG